MNAEITQWYDFTGKSIIITGGTGVLCGEMARSLHTCGANVTILGHNLARAQQMADSLISLPGGGQSLAVEADVLDAAALQSAVAKVITNFGQVDGLINGAGGNKMEASTSASRTFFDLPEEALRWVFDLNLLGTILPTQVVGRHMLARKQGVILNITSMSAIRPLTRVLGYSAAKAGVSNFTQWLAVYLAQEYSPGIRVNAIAPGFFVTGQNRSLLTDEHTGELTARGKKIIDHTPMGRFGVPADLIGTVLWLLSPASAFVTGIVVPVDGGFSAYSGV